MVFATGGTSKHGVVNNTVRQHVTFHVSLNALHTLKILHIQLLSPRDYCQIFSCISPLSLCCKFDRQISPYSYVRVEYNVTDTRLNPRQIDKLSQLI